MEIIEGSVVAMKNLRVSEWNGRSLNSSSSPGDFFSENIDHPDAKKVKTWFG
jgi:hypothetical protein